MDGYEKLRKFEKIGGWLLLLGGVFCFALGVHTVFFLNAGLGWSIPFLLGTGMFVCAGIGLVCE